MIAEATENLPAFIWIPIVLCAAVWYWHEFVTPRISRRRHDR